MTAAARSVSPDSVTTPTARPSSTSTSRTGVPTRMTAPRAVADVRHRLGDGAHAADGVTPDAALAVHLAKHVVQQHVRRARGVGTRVVADDAVEAVHGLDGIALEPAVEVVAGGHGKEREQLAPERHVELPQPAADLRGAHQLRQRRAPAAGHGVRRRRQHQVAQHVGDRIEPLAVAGEPRGIARREARHLALRAPATGEQVVAVRRWAGSWRSAARPRAVRAH